MKKILLAVDPLNPSTNALDFACFLGRLTRSKITGVFLENLRGHEKLNQEPVPAGSSSGWIDDDYPEKLKEKLNLIENRLISFQEGCTAREVSCKIHRDAGVPVLELIKESRFADVIVVDAETSFFKTDGGVPSEFIRNILKRSECPVIIAPEKFESVEEIVFTYNGTGTAVFAIKQFTYLFPEFRNKKVSIIRATGNGEWLEKDRHKFTEWLEGHYTDLHFEVVQGKSDLDILKHLLYRENIFLVTGAYGSKDWLRLFNQDPAEVLIKAILQPIFISHICRSRDV